MDPQQQQLVDRIKQAQNILVTVSASPSVDQLAAAIALTLVLNKMGKHGTAVFSGQVPSTIEFLKPEETLEKTTDSLRDFIIALDKSKADKLRYKVEDDVVRIFITPYRTSLSDKDLEFSQGDFNVDVVVALGVTAQADLDSAITAHGRILHDATVVSVSTEGQGELGSINWIEPNASSLCEMVVGLADALDKKVMDSQIATALLTGIVASTERFRNDKTSPKTMSASAELMSAGANQRLIATELETPESSSESEHPEESAENQDEPAPEPEQTESKPESNESDQPEAPAEDEPAKEAPKAEPGTLEIEHEGDSDGAEPNEAQATDLETPESEDEEVSDQPQIDVDEEGTLSIGGNSETQIGAVRGVGSDGTPTESSDVIQRERITEPPQVGNGDLTANTKPEALDPPTEELSLPSPLAPPLLRHDESVLGSSPTVPVNPQPAPVDWQPPAPPAPVVPSDDVTLSDIEASVDSPHAHGTEPAPTGPPSLADLNTNVDDARNAVEAALNSPGAPADPLKPIAALNAQPLGPELQNNAPSEVLNSTAPPLPPISNTGFSEPTPGNSPADQTLDMPIPANPFGSNPLAPPPVAPPTSAFPGAPAPNNDQNGGGQAPPPVPPPMLPPLG